MQKYKYTAINLQKKKFTGIFLANDEKDLAAQLARQNLFLVSSSPYSDKTPSAFFTLGTGKVPLSDLTTFCRQFSIMLASGISVFDSLESLKSQPYSSYFKTILQVIYEDVKSGIMLSKAIEKHSKVFPEFFRSMIVVGEASGKLDMVFNSLADYYEKDSALKRKIKSAFSYPLMILFLMLAIIILMLAFVIPTFKNTLADMEVSIEGFTKIVYDCSDFLTANWLYMLAILIVIGLIFFGFSKTKVGIRTLDYVKMHAPVFKKVNVALISARFARSFSLLLASGMDMVEALDAVNVVLGNTDVKKRFAAATEEVKHGMPLASAFDTYKLFPPLMIQMIAVGEKTASLEQILSDSCNYFDDQAEATLTSVTGKIQPILLLVMGAVIAVMFLAVYSPIISIMQGI